MKQKGALAWTDDEHRRLCAMAGEGRSWEEIGAAPGRSDQACYTHYRRGHQPGGPRNRRVLLDFAAQARRDAAGLPPRSLTAEFFGDPLPGRSALDQRKAAAPEICAIPLAGTQ